MENSQKNIQKEQEENLAIGQQILSQLIQMNKHMSSMDSNITKLNKGMERMEGKIDKLLNENKEHEEPKKQPKEDQKIEIKKEDETEEEKKKVVEGKHINLQKDQEEKKASLRNKDFNKSSGKVTS